MGKPVKLKNPDLVWCPKCCTEKEPAEFYRNKHNANGLHSYCKPCWRAYQSAANKKAREAVVRRRQLPYQPRLSDDWKERWFLMTGVKPD